MDYSTREKLEKITSNKYEAVIVSAKLARKLNNDRLAVEEHLGPDAPLPDYSQKVTTEAMDLLVDGKATFYMKDVADSEEQIFLDEQI